MWQVIWANWGHRYGFAAVGFGLGGIRRGNLNRCWGCCSARGPASASGCPSSLNSSCCCSWFCSCRWSCCIPFLQNENTHQNLINSLNLGISRAHATIHTQSGFNSHAIWINEIRLSTYRSISISGMKEIRTKIRIIIKLMPIKWNYKFINAQFNWKHSMRCIRIGIRRKSNIDFDCDYRYINEW